MHIEKNICDNIVGTLLELDGKNKDTVSARVDLKKMNIRSKYWMKDEGDSCFKPHAPWTLEKEKKKHLCMPKLGSQMVFVLTGKGVWILKQENYMV
jgi:hypothetical protein